MSSGVDLVVKVHRFYCILLTSAHLVASSLVKVFDANALSHQTIFMDKLLFNFNSSNIKSIVK